MRVKQTTSKYRYFLLSVVFIAAFACASRATAFDKRLQAGISTGYSATYIRKENIPNIFNGLALGGHIEYGLNRVFAISIDGAIDLHRPYRPWVKGERPNSEGEMVPGWVEGPINDKYFLSTGAFSVLYAIDLFRIVPIISVGFVATREDRRIDGEHQTSRAFGFRIGGGFEYYFKHFSVGAGIHSDRYVGSRDNDLVNRIAFSVKGAVVFDFGAKSLE